MRVPDWEQKLDSMLRDRASWPFEFGKHDCVMLAADITREITGGLDLAEKVRGTYSDRAGSEQCMKDAAGGDFQAAVAAVMESRAVPEVAPALAQRGDLVLVMGQDGPTLGIVGLEGSDSWAPGPNGLIAFPTRKAMRAWRT